MGLRLAIAALGAAAILAACGDSETSGDSAEPAGGQVAKAAPDGARVFQRCSVCHTIAEGGPNMVGPNLHGMFGKTVGFQDGFAYSDAVKDADFVWTPELLDEWLAKPREFLPGNRMAFAGIPNADDRAALITYLQAETQ